MPINVILAIIEGVVEQVPSVIAAFNTWKSAVNSGADPTAAQLAMYEAAVDAAYKKLVALQNAQPVAAVTGN